MLGTGRDRTQDNTRQKTFSRLSDDDMHDLSHGERNAEVDGRLGQLDQAHTFGAKLEGVPARGVVLEVRKGNFLTRILECKASVNEGLDITQGLSHTLEMKGQTERPVSPFISKVGMTLRTFVRGTLQQFDLGLSSVVAPGDEIELVVPTANNANDLIQQDIHGILTAVLPRRSEFRRVHPSGRSLQTLAANVDRVFVVASTAEPAFRPGFVDRVLVCAAASGLSAALIMNKIDLGIAAADEALLDVYRSLGIPIFKVSATGAGTATNEIEALKTALAGSRSVLTGHSGVGKSSLLLALDSSLSGATVRTGGISNQTGKGTHTTTHAKLFSLQLGNGMQAEVVDTPGVREFTPTDTDRQNLWGWFPEMAKLQGQCAYANCTHTREKGCAVLEALERGEIHPRRHQSYVRIYETLPQ